MNGDGRDEILVGAMQNDRGSGSANRDVGAAYVVFSSADWIGNG